MEEIITNNYRIKPYFISEQLKESNIMLKRKQISNYLYRKKKKEIPEEMNIADFHTWVSERLNVPSVENIHEPFILMDQTHSNNLRISITTRNLLRIMKYGSTIHVDGTYRLNTCRYPLLVGGVSNKSRSLFPSVYVVTTSETSEDYSFIFQSMLVGCRKQNLMELNINWIMADGAESISKAITNTYGCNCVRGMCFFHVVFNIKKNLRGIEKKIKRKIIKYISFIQISKDEAEFDLALILFCERLEEYNNGKINDFIKYFINQWSMNNYRWYEGAYKDVPKTNNCLESHSKELKQNGTIRQSLPFSEYIETIWNFVRSTSENIDLEKVFNFNVYGNVLTSEWEKAFIFSEELKKIKVQKKEIIILNLVEKCEKEEVPIAKTFKEFMYIKNNIIMLSKGIECYECSCREYLKKYRCLHSLAVNILFLNKMPIFQISSKILKNIKKRGRKKSIGHALQNNNSNVYCFVKIPIILRKNTL